MTNSENNSIRSEEAPIEQPAQDTDSNVFLSAKMYAGMSAGLAFIANVESIAGLEAVSTVTLRTAGAVALGAAVGGVAGLVKVCRRN